MITHKEVNKQDQEEIPLLHHYFGHKDYHQKRKRVPDIAKSKNFLNSFLVILKSGLCSNNKSTALSIVSFKGMLVNKLQTSS